MRIITDDEANARLHADDNLANRLNHARCGLVGRTCDPIPQNDRPIIAALDAVGVKQKDIAEMFDTTQASVSNISRESAQRDIRSHVMKPVVDKALDILLDSMDSMTPDKIAQAKLKDLASVATSMAKIVDSTKDKHGDASVPQVVVTIYSPGQKRSDQYPTIEV